MRNMIKYLMGVQGEPSETRINASSEARLNRLNYHKLMGVYHRERLEAHAARCCEEFGVDPNADSVERDWCNEIVYHGTDPAIVVRSIENYRGQHDGE